MNVNILIYLFLRTNAYSVNHLDHQINSIESVISLKIHILKLLKNYIVQIKKPLRSAVFIKQKRMEN